MYTEDYRVGIAGYKAASRNARIVTIGLGSCVGIALYDSINKIGGLAHIMLPDSTQFMNVTNPGKFPDLAIPLLIKDMEALGASRSNIIARICGGASMFNFSDKSLIMDIGNRNVKSVKEILSKLSIFLKGEDTGGSQGRTMELYVEDGSTMVKAVNCGIKQI